MANGATARREQRRGISILAARLVDALISRKGTLLGVILAAAFSVRLLGVGRGLPYIHEWDEPTVLSNVIGMLQRGDLDPGAFVYPSVYYYMLLPVVYLHYWYLHVFGGLGSVWDIRLHHPLVGKDAYWWYLSPASFYLWARTLTALVGTATVYLVYRVGKEVYGPTVGLLAAALLALAPGAVYYSDTVRVDIPMAFFVVLTVLAGLGVMRHGRWLDYLVAGILAGIAVSTKTSAIIVVLTLLAAHLFGRHRTRPVNLRLTAMGLCVPAGFVIGTPYALLTPNAVITQSREQALAYGGLPTLDAMRRVLPGYLGYFVHASHGTEWYVIPHIALGVLPTAAAVVGMIAGFHWDRRLHLYLLSFPLAFFIFMSGQRELVLRTMAAVIPFAALFAAVGGVWAWGWAQTRSGRTSRAHALAAIALAVLLAAPARDAVALGWTIGHTPDTRSAAVEWLRRHVPPGARIAFDSDLRWYVPDLDRLPFALRFAPEHTALTWYSRRHVDFAVVGAESPLRSLPAVAVFHRPAYLGGETRSDGRQVLVVDPTVYIVRPTAPDITAAFPRTLDRSDMILEPITTTGGAVYSEIVHLPNQRFAPGWYTLALAGEWPRAWMSLNFTPRTLAVTVRVGSRAADTVTLTDTERLRFTTPAFRVDELGALPVQVTLAFWIQNLQTLDNRYQTEWALHPGTGCPITPNVPSLNVRRLTLEAWVYLEDMNAPLDMWAHGGESEAPILSKGNHVGYYLRLVGDRANRIFADLSVAGKSSVARAGYVAFRTWTHIAATYDGHQARIYLNGFPMPSVRDPHYDGTVHAKNAPLVIGCRDPGTPDQLAFPGLISEVRVWNRILSPGVIWDEARLHLLPDTTAGLVGSWSFQSLVRGAIPDLTGEGHNFNAESIERARITGGPLAHPVWRYGEVNLLRAVTIDRVR